MTEPPQLRTAEEARLASAGEKPKWPFIIGLFVGLACGVSVVLWLKTQGHY